MPACVSGSWQAERGSHRTRRHPRDDPRAEVGEDVYVGVRVRVGPVEFQLNADHASFPSNAFNSSTDQWAVCFREIVSCISVLYFNQVKAGASIWDRGTCPPNIYEGGGTSVVMSPNILEVMPFRMSTRVTATVVCCILTQILCLVPQIRFSFWGTSFPNPPTGVPTLEPTGDFRLPDPQSFLCPPIIL